MEISFDDKKLEKLANSDKAGRKKLGPKRHDLFKRRLDQLRASKNLEDLRYAPGRFHELKGGRKGQWACDLDHPYRLVFTAQEKPIPRDDSGRHLWVEIKAVEILEIADYH